MMAHMPEVVGLRPSDPVRIAQYRVLGRLGAGGQGVVYLAETPSGERVAVKQLLAGGLDDAATTPDPVFGLAVPQHIPGVPPEVMNPRGTWADAAAYDAQSQKLAAMFRENIKKFGDAVINRIAEFAPNMIYVRNDDKPGFIGRFGTLLGESGVNVATFALGRDKPGGDAICFVSVDQPVSDELLRRIEEIPQVKRARAVRF